MDGFKLVVADGRAHQVRHSDRLVMPELFKVAHQFGDVVMMGRNKGCVGEIGTADPVLAGAEFARLLVLAADSVHQHGMGLLEQPVGQGQRFELGHSRVDRVDVVLHLAPVVALFRPNLLFWHQGLIDAGLGAFDAAGGLGLLDHVHLDEEIDVRHDQRKGVEFAQGPVGLLEQGVDGGVFPDPVMVDRHRLEALVLKALLPTPGRKGFELHAASFLTMAVRTLILPVTAAVIRAVRYSFRRSMAASILAMRLSILVIFRSR